MDQMEHNVKIKNYKTNLEPSPFVKTVKILDYPRKYESSKEQERMLERFKDLHWQREKVLSIQGHEDRLAVLRYQENDILSRQAKQKEDMEKHRIKHLEGIKDNIDEARSRFLRRTELDRQITKEEHLKQHNGTLYKIINDGVPTKY